MLLVLAIVHAGAALSGNTTAQSAAEYMLLVALVSGIGGALGYLIYDVRMTEKRVNDVKLRKASLNNVDVSPLKLVQRLMAHSAWHTAPIPHAFAHT